MPYIKKKYKSGRTVDYEYHYTFRHNDGPGLRRNPKEKPTKEAQKKVNRRKAAKDATRTMNASFGPDDYYITYTYRVENRPDEDTLKKHMKRLLDKLRTIQKKAGRQLKYMWTAEVGKRGATHIHMVVNHINLQAVRDAWKHGYTRVIPLDDTGQYRKLAEYLIKYSNQTEDVLGHTIGKRCNCSRNLVHPKPETQVITGRKKIPDTIPVPKGYYLDKETERRGIHELTGYEYLQYTLIRMEGGPNERKKRI